MASLDRLEKALIVMKSSQFQVTDLFSCICEDFFGTHKYSRTSHHTHKRMVFLTVLPHNKCPSQVELFTLISLGFVFEGTINICAPSDHPVTHTRKSTQWDHSYTLTYTILLLSSSYYTQTESTNTQPETKTRPQTIWTTDTNTHLRQRLDRGMSWYILQEKTSAVWSCRITHKNVRRYNYGILNMYLGRPRLWYTYKIRIAKYGST